MAEIFKKLDPALQRWIFRQGWQDLLPVQKAALDPVLEGKSDVIISASTASGKTEAAFLPALTAVNRPEVKKGIRILCVSPLKALINDQYRRLDLMTGEMHLRITPWHGDVGGGHKDQLIKDPDGVLLTTPESLESLLISRRRWLKDALAPLHYIIVDEFHAFMGTQRGYQLQSQLHRVENLCGRLIPRIALSATFSNSDDIALYLRPQGNMPCKVVTGEKTEEDTLALQLRGYAVDVPVKDKKEPQKDVHEDPENYQELATDLFRLMRGKVNLVFCNSRFQTELIAGILQEMSEKTFVPNEFFPHHGSLSKELRESLEHRLIEGRLPTTAVCTATLELGIDISDVQSIAQVEAPLSVASIRQRLGRSGRRDHKSVLRLFIPEYFFPGEQNFCLCESTFISAAIINLLLQRWYEPPLKHEYAFSTMLQQTLSVIASVGSASAGQLYALLCKTGSFTLCSPKIFAEFLRDLGANDLITQLNDGTLTLGLEGEKLVSDWSFYSAFSAPPEYIIENDGRRVGSVPLTTPLQVGDFFMFAGRNWQVVFFSSEKRVIGVKKTPYSAAPLLVNGSGGQVHDRVREEMYQLYLKGEVPPYLNKQAKMNFMHGLMTFKRYHMDKKLVIAAPKGLEIYPWKGDRIMRTMGMMLKRHSVNSSVYLSHLELQYCSLDTLREAVKEICAHPEVTAFELTDKMGNLNYEKHDHYISKDLKRLSYAWSSLDVPGALECFRKIAKEL